MGRSPRTAVILLPSVEHVTHIFREKPSSQNCSGVCLSGTCKVQWPRVDSQQCPAWALCQGLFHVTPLEELGVPQGLRCTLKSRLLAGQEWRCRRREWTCHRERRGRVGSIGRTALTCIHLLFSRQVTSSPLRHGGQHARLLCPSTISQSLLKLMSIESVMPSNHLILFPSIRVFSNESVPCIRWSKYWSFSIIYTL